MRKGCFGHNMHVTQQTCSLSTRQCCLLQLQAWIEEVSAFVKAADPNHLVTVGEEGFYGPGSPDLGSNPSPGLSTPQVLTACEGASTCLISVQAACQHIHKACMQSFEASSLCAFLACGPCHWCFLSKSLA